MLVVEDEESLRIGLADVLSDEGYEVSVADSGRAARDRLASEDPDLVVLDVMLPDVDGYTLCRELRSAGRKARVFMLTARTLEDDIVRGFEAGADDYLEKPYRLRELLARVRALLRRADPNPQAPELRFADFVLDVGARALLGPKGRVELTRTEFDILRLFVERRGKALSRDEIIDVVWGAGVVVDVRTVDNFVSSLKRKLGWREGAAYRFRSLRGVGYCLEVAGA
ncbi:MAG: response regulator transcription factor [Deltaproteobacteria bacterium]|nr:response regulator transcription factor [Deltaproteobacteria bacterium]